MFGRLMVKLHRLFLAVLALSSGCALADISRPGGSGHALLFRDHGIVIENFQDLAPNELTFEAWIRTSDWCHRSAIFSHALPSTSPDEAQRTADFNSFVIFDPLKLVACHDFQYIDLWPDPNGVSCYAAYNHSAALPSIVSRDGRWHHVAVVWTSANNGLTKVYVDGLLRVQTPTGKTAPLRPGGALMLGAEQDCYGGCLDPGQGFMGEMDEVRIWRTARSQADILAHMRDASGLDRHPDLAAYWHFNDPEEVGLLRSARVATDSSGRGNDLRLFTLPSVSMQHIEGSSKAPGSMEAGSLTFRNNYAMNQVFEGMPEGDISVEFWARTPAVNASVSADEWAEFFSFASVITDPIGRTATTFLDDAILIEKYTQEFRGTSWIDYKQITTTGSISVHINANREGMGGANDHWIDYNVGWVDDKWHHIAATWSKSTGEVALYFDGQPATPYWVSNAGATEVNEPEKGGVSRRIATGAAATQRSPRGSLVLGSKQENMGGMFSPHYSLHGSMANVRVWDRVLSQQEVGNGMFTSDPPHKDGLKFSYSFDPGAVLVNPEQDTATIKDAFSPLGNDLYLGADAPQWVYSSVPLALPNGAPVPGAVPGSAGFALTLNDQQALILKGFKDFPAEELTVEFWMLSSDTCHRGVPFSYAAIGATYSKNDNAFLLFDYGDWGISVVEDEGTFSDHTAGIGANDGRWHHIAVTWRSFDGQTKLYDNGREVWSVTRGKGQRIPSGGTLVIGREQDCEGGCFDSDPGAAGDVSPTTRQEYNSQDFFGQIDEMRIWRRVRSPEEIAAGMRSSLDAKARTGRPGTGPVINPKDDDLVAYWNFDEGQGYSVNDITGKGHTLLATQPTRWEVVRWLAACGNGILEPGEECDDGGLTNGDGCSSECKVQPGWECTATSPSRCWKKGEKPPTPPSGPSSGGGDVPTPPTPDPGSPKKSHAVLRGMLIAIGVCAAVMVAAAAAYTQRHAVYERFPVVEDAVEDAVAAVREWVTALGRGRGRYAFAGDGVLDVDPGDMGSPEFTRSMPAPGRGGYMPLPGSAPRGA